MSITNLLNQNGFIMANKKIIKQYGLHEAILLGALCSKQDYWDDPAHWDGDKYGQYDGFFFCTANELEEETTLSPYLQRNAFKNLTEQGLIETKLKGVPALKWFKVNEKKLQMIFLDLEETSVKESNDLNPCCENFSQLDAEESDGNNIKSNDIKSKDKSLKCENKFSQEIEEILSYLNQVTGSKYKSKSAGHRRIISARLNEGFTIDDFKTIIDKKYACWHDTDYEKFLRPSTLFSTTHFEEYLNEPMRKKFKNSQPPKVVISEWDGTFDDDTIY